MGQCGQGNFNSPIRKPMKIINLEGVPAHQISAGTSHSIVWTAVPSNRYVSSSRKLVDKCVIANHRILVSGKMSVYVVHSVLICTRARSRRFVNSWRSTEASSKKTLSRVSIHSSEYIFGSNWVCGNRSQLTEFRHENVTLFQRDYQEHDSSSETRYYVHCW